MTIPNPDRDGEEAVDLYLAQRDAIGDRVLRTQHRIYDVRYPRPVLALGTAMSAAWSGEYDQAVRVLDDLDRILDQHVPGPDDEDDDGWWPT